MGLGNDQILLSFFVDMYNRFKLAEILKRMNSFDEEASVC